MYDADAIEAINAEQIATVTDRLLLQGDLLARRRLNPQSFARGSQPRIDFQPARGSSPRIDRRIEHTPTPRRTIAHASELPYRGPQAYEHTAIMRSASSYAQVFAVTVVIPTLVGVAVGLAALL